ncbi:MAG: hypothetical protein GY788_10115 [bacterium]|nr:hypothetical protein [bacterium]
MIVGDRLEFWLRRRIAWGRAGFIVAGTVLVRVLVAFWVNPPVGGWFGTSGVIPRVIAVVGIPATVYVIAAMLWSFTQSGPELAIDSSGIVAKTLFRTRHVSWEQVAHVKLHNADGEILMVYLETGDTFKIATATFDGDWARDSVLAEMRRFSGRRLTAD